MLASKDMKRFTLVLCIISLIFHSENANAKKRISRRGNVIIHTPSPFSGLQLASGQVPVAVPVPVPIPYPTGPTHQKIVIYPM